MTPAVGSRGRGVAGECAGSLSSPHSLSKSVEGTRAPRGCAERARVGFADLRQAGRCKQRVRASPSGLPGNRVLRGESARQARPRCGRAVSAVGLPRRNAKAGEEETRRRKANRQASRSAALCGTSAKADWQTRGDQKPISVKRCVTTGVDRPRGNRRAAAQRKGPALCGAVRKERGRVREPSPHAAGPVQSMVREARLQARSRRAGDATESLAKRATRPAAKREDWRNAPMTLKLRNRVYRCENRGRGGIRPRKRSSPVRDPAR